MPRFIPRLPRSGWKRWLALVGVTVLSLFLLLVVTVVSLILAWRSPKFQGWAMTKMMERTPPAFAEDAMESPGIKPTFPGPEPDGHTVRAAADIFVPTNVWTIRLSQSALQWQAMQPNHVRAAGDFNRGEEAPVLFNTNAPRNGLAGVLGLDFPWSAGDVEIGGVAFTNTGLRFKGNGTYLSAIRSYKRPYKLDLNHQEKGRAFGGRSTFNLGNLGADNTCLSDTLAYELFRDAGVPAPRTAFARVFLSAGGVTTNRLLGLYVMVENPDGAWARERFGTNGVALFKPVTPELFRDLGPEWAAYARNYDPKTKLTPAQQQRVIDFARLQTGANDVDFAAQVGDFVDLDEAARFLACEVLLSNYDGIHAQGQNFLLYLDRDARRFGIIPWDLDHSWGEFPFISTAADREGSDIWHPWVGTNRFLDRLFAVPAFRQRYQAELERLLAGLFTPERLYRRLDEVAAAVRPAVAEMSAERVQRFDTAVSAEIQPGPRETDPMDPHRPTWQLKRFIAARAQNVRDQLAGKVAGIRVRRQAASGK